MIESIYSKENKEGKERSNTNVMFRMPKNIRQIGQVESNRKIYIEDYVMTYVRQLAMKDYSNYKVAVLLGQFVKIDGFKSIFISGAVEANGVDIETQSAFSNEIWTNIYDDVKKYFDDVEIVGWYISKPGITLDSTDQIQKVHVDNFAGQDKALLMYDSIEKEEAFHVFSDSKLMRQKGYYIYYEKNEEMQNYMVENKKVSSIDEGYNDRAIKEIRHIIEGKKENIEPKEQGNVVRLLYTASTLLALVVLVIGATMLNNYDKMQSIENTLDVISQHVIGKEDNLSKTEGSKETSNTTKTAESIDAIEPTEDKVTEVETMSGNIEKIKEGQDIIPADGSKENANKTLSESVKEENEEAQANDTEKKEVPTQKKETSETTKSTSTKDAATKEKTEKKTPAKETASTPRYYTIKTGDSLLSISMKFYNSVEYVEKILKANNIENQDKILVGQKIIIP